MSVPQPYKVYCLSEKKIVYGFSATPLTQCPNISHHTIVPESVTLATEYNGQIKTVEDSEGYFETTNIKMSIPSGPPGEVTEHDVNWPMDILLWRSILTPSSDMIGDELNVVAGPETTVGMLTAPVNIGDTVLNVSPTVTTNTWRGFLITLDDGVNKDILGRCSNVDADAGTITVKTATSYAYAAGTTPVKISIYILKDIDIIDTNIIPVGDKGFKGKKLEAGTNVRVYYTNNSGTAKTLRWRPEYYNLG